MMDLHTRDKHKSGGHYHQDTVSSVVDWDADEDTEKPSLCCLQGCISVTVVGVSFFVGLPSGILLVVQALNNGRDTTLLSVGIGLIILPILILIIVLILCLNQNRLPNLVCCKKTKFKPVASKASKSNQTEPSKKANGHVNSQHQHYHHDNQSVHNNHHDNKQHFDNNNQHSNFNFDEMKRVVDNNDNHHNDDSDYDKNENSNNNSKNNNNIHDNNNENHSNNVNGNPSIYTVHPQQMAVQFPSHDNSSVVS